MSEYVYIRMALSKRANALKANLVNRIDAPNQLTTYLYLHVELAKYGEVEEMNVCDNVGDHLVGSKLTLYVWI
jgi:hypothetical protein